MRARTQITLPPEVEARARRRAADVGVSLERRDIRRLCPGILVNHKLNRRPPRPWSIWERPAALILRGTRTL